MQVVFRVGFQIANPINGDLHSDKAKRFPGSRSSRRPPP